LDESTTGSDRRARDDQVGNAVKWGDRNFASCSRYFFAPMFLAGGNAGSDLLGRLAAFAVVFATCPFGGFRKARETSGRVNRLSRMVVEPVDIKWQPVLTGGPR
jgi:hypothetical protein